MTPTIDWMMLARSVTAQLSIVQQAAEHGLLPPEAIKEMKRAVDDCRIALWEATVSSTETPFAGTAMILNARFARVQEMCDKVVEEVAAGHVWAGTPGLARFVAALDETERRVRSVFEASASAQSGSG